MAVDGFLVELLEEASDEGFVVSVEELFGGFSACFGEGPATNLSFGVVDGLEEVLVSEVEDTSQGVTVVAMVSGVFGGEALVGAEVFEERLINRGDGQFFLDECVEEELGNFSFTGLHGDLG